MQLKVLDIVSIVNILSRAKINRIIDRKQKLTLLEEYRNLRKISNDSLHERDEALMKFQEDWKDEIAVALEFEESKKKPEGLDDFYKAKKDTEKYLEGLFEAVVEVDIIPIPMDTFNKVCDDLTLDQLTLLLDNSILE